MDDNTVKIALAIYSSVATIALPLYIYINRISSARAIRRMNSYEEGMESLLSAMSKAVNDSYIFMSISDKEKNKADVALNIAKDSVKSCHEVFDKNRGKLLQSLRIGVSPIFADYSVCLMSSLDEFTKRTKEIEGRDELLKVNFNRYQLMYKMYVEAHTTLGYITRNK